MNTPPWRVVIDRLADADVVEIVEYLDARSTQAGDSFLAEFNRSAELLATHPGAGPVVRKTGILKGLRSWPMTTFGPYIIFFLPLPGELHVVRVLHGARDLIRELRRGMRGR